LTTDSNADPAEVAKKGGFFYCPEEAIDQRERGHIMLDAQFIAICSSSILVETLGYTVSFSSP
jgi:hypothetical protein